MFHFIVPVPFMDRPLLIPFRTVEEEGASDKIILTVADGATGSGVDADGAIVRKFHET
jgi:hypothetical protein